MAQLGNVVIQVRAGEMDQTVFIRIGEWFRQALVQHSSGAGLLSVLEEGSPILSPQLRAHQAATLKELLGMPHARCAVAVLGDSVEASLQRSASAGASLQAARGGVYRAGANLQGACTWLSRELTALKPGSPSSSDLEDAVAYVRRAIAIKRGSG